MNMSEASSLPPLRLMLNTLMGDKFTDVTFIIGAEKREFKASKAFLSLHSAVFKAMFHGEMIESQPNAKIPINDIDPDAFKSVLKYCHGCIYNEVPQLTPDNVVPIIIIADRYQINGLLQRCDEHFSYFLRGDTFCTILDKLVNAKLDKYIKKCMDKLKYKLGNYAEFIVKSPGFLKMGLNAMKVFLQSDNLCIKDSSEAFKYGVKDLSIFTEEDLWLRLLEWSEHNASNKRYDCLYNLFYYCKLYNFIFLYFNICLVIRIAILMEEKGN